MWASDLAPHGVELRFGDAGAVIALDGQVDVETGLALIDAATSAVARYPAVELDLGRVTAIDEPGLRSLVKVQRFADAYGVAVTVVRPSPAVEAALAEAGLTGQLGTGPAAG